MSFDEQNLLRNQTEQALANAGWEFECELKVAPGRFRITGDAMHESVPVADYLLRFRGIALAVVETKFNAANLDAATEQATAYARRAGLAFAIATDGVRWSVRNLLSGEVSLSDTPPFPEELASQSNIELNADGWGQAIAAEPFTDEAQPTTLQRYQEQAILATLLHFANGNRRASLLMSPNVGLRFTVFQLIWKLMSANVLKNRRVLFVTNRRHRVDEAYQCFAGFGDTRFIVDGHGELDAHHGVFFSTLQMLCHDGGSGKLYENYSNDYFDLIVFDDCQSVLGSWGGILSHFENSLQLGTMDAPHLKAFEYFGEPVFAYSMAQAINDGYLLPFLLESRLPTLEIPDGEFLLDEQLERSIVTAGQTRTIASDLWKALSRFDKSQRKSIVFCVNNSHAEMMAAELQRVSRDPSFAAHISASHRDSQTLIERFRIGDEGSPRVAVSVDLLSKVIIPDVTNIVLARPISNPAVFSSLVALGALPCDAIGKRYFTVFDYCDSVRFLDADWMGSPENDRAIVQHSERSVTVDTSDHVSEIVEPNDLRELGQAIRDLSKNSLPQLLKIWASRDKRSRFIEELGGQTLIEKLTNRLGMHGVDDADVLAKVGFGLEDVATRKDRVRQFWGFEGPWLRKRLELKENTFESDGNAGSWKLAFWRVTLDHYSLYGIDRLERGQTYQFPPFVGQFGSFQTLTSKYGGPKKLRADLEAIKEKIYAPVVSSGGDTE
jgi:type I restriction enzyme R subunit